VVDLQAYLAKDINSFLLILIINFLESIRLFIKS